MTTPFMKLHGDRLPLKKPKPRKRLKPRVTKIVIHGSCRYDIQAKALQQALGWMDTVQFQHLALDVIKSLHTLGFRIATKAPKKIIKTRGSDQ